MTVDTRLEQLYGRIELIKGQGDPNRGQLCIMSFVAFLAGEGHSDHPTSASPVIRRFSIIINDEMPMHLRQQLKPFAPRILGTNDEFDEARMELLRAATRNELLPRLAADFGDATMSRAAGPAITSLLKSNGSSRQRMSLLAEEIMAVPPRPWADVPAAAARLLVLCAKSAAPAAQQEWYWAKAVELLDCLCHVGADRNRPAVQMDRVAWLERVAEYRERRGQRATAALRIVHQVWGALTGA